MNVTRTAWQKPICAGFVHPVAMQAATAHGRRNVDHSDEKLQDVEFYAEWTSHLLSAIAIVSRLGGCFHSTCLEHFTYRLCARDRKGIITGGTKGNRGTLMFNAYLPSDSCSQ